MTELDNFALFAVGLLVTIPTATVLVALVFAAGFDERAEKKRLSQQERSTTERA